MKKRDKYPFRILDYGNSLELIYLLPDSMITDSICKVKIGNGYWCSDRKKAFNFLNEIIEKVLPKK